MKRQLATIALLSAALVGIAPAAGPAPAAAAEGQLAAVVAQVQAQQLLLAENQAKIEAKLATVAEAVRQARVFASRTGR